MRFNHELKSLILAAFLMMIICVSLLSTQIFPSVKSIYSGVAKPMQFYFHYADIPVDVAGLQTKFIMNTQKNFSFSTQQAAKENSLYKPLGLPKIVIDFYLYPNFAGPVTINGSWQLFIWLNGSAYKPSSYSLNFKEVSIGGVVLWNSGQINPTVTSSIGAYIDVPVYNYNLSTQLSHTFSVGTTLLVEFEINAGSSADTRFWYDSELYPSKVILPAEDYARPTMIKTYSIDDSQTTLFHYNWTEDWRKVIVRTNVTDPFGGYDIYKVNATILDPTGYPVLEDIEMTRVSNGQWQVNYIHLFEVNWSYPTAPELGNYTITVTVIDNNGYYHYLDSGSFEPFIEEETKTFEIGAITYYDPIFSVTDDVDEPLPNAQVYITWRNGTTETLPLYTSIQGTINLTQIQAGTYGFTILWKDAVVAQTTVYVNSNGPYTIKTHVYQLTVQVYGNNGAPIHGAYIIVSAPSGVGYGLETTDNTGKALFKLPSGTYTVSAHYTTDYLMTVIRTSSSEDVSVTASTSQSIVLTDYPPPVWSTILFLLLIGGILAAITVLALLFLIRRRR